MFRNTASIALMTMALSPAALFAQGRAPGQPMPQPVQDPGSPVETEKTVIRTYDLTELFRVPRNYPLPPGVAPSSHLAQFARTTPGDESMFGGPGPGGMSPGGFGGEMGMPTQPPRTDTVVSLIIGTVAPETWREAGGALGSARLLGTRLVVSQTESNHKLIEDLLNGIRDEGGGAYMVRVNAYWVQLTPEDLRAIAGKSTDAAATLKEVPDALLTDAKLYSSGQTLGFNGQTVHVASGRSNTIVTGIEQLGAQQAVGYKPEPSTVQGGVALQVTPQVLREGKMVSLDLHSIVTELDDAAPRPDPRVLGQDGPTTKPIEQAIGNRSRVASQEFSTTARVPVGKKVLIGGMTFDPGAGADGAKQLYLVIEANAIK